ncbi:hypothetical protein ACFC09_34585 [Streptomyces sp. NPDC056161]|uniref:hypothetical protein n=1 Tax=Streptomyces sp. NPDC056161 TaxID=3345732 RepID=UPI0035E3804F
MTWATRTVRIAAAAAGLTGTLTLSACGGGDSADDTTPRSSTSAATGSASATAGATASGGTLQGSWLTTNGGKAVALVVNGKQAGLFTTGGSVCSGTAGEESGMQMIHLTCTDGSSDRETGMVDSVAGDNLKVTWSGKLGTETYTKAEGGKLPAGLPTANLGS